MKQRDVTDNAIRWDPEQPRSEDRTDDGQVEKCAAYPSLGWCPPFWGIVARWSWWIVGTLQDHGGVRLLACARIPLCFVLAVDLSTQHQHPVRWTLKQHPAPD